MKILLLSAIIPALALAQAPLQPRSASAFNQSGAEIRLKNPLQNLFEFRDADTLRIVPLDEIAGCDGAVILDFEHGSGWPAVEHELVKAPQGEGWIALSNLAGLLPFQSEEAVPPVKVGAVTVTMTPAVFSAADDKPRDLDPGNTGVFLVKSPEGAMPSGAQGLVAAPRLVPAAADGPVQGEERKGLPVGFLIRFSPPVKAAGFAHFNGDIVVAVFGKDDKLLGQIRQGAKPDAVFSYGFEGGAIHAIFVGNVFAEDGVLDDLVFVP
ncbi:MAG: hypothetical protein WC003_13910 [Terrimicrobiaceae bacterium]